MRPTIALFVLEALPNAQAVRRLVIEQADRIVLVGLSNPGRPSIGGHLGQVRRLLLKSGLSILPYLATNFAIGDVAQALSAARHHRSLNATMSLRAICRRLAIPVVRVDFVNGEVVADALGKAGPDLILTFHFDQILTAETLARAALGGLNVHPSLLPRHRGPTPTVHALAEPQAKNGVTIHRLGPEIDRGPILAQKSVQLEPGTTASRAARLLHGHGCELLGPLLKRIEAEGMPEGSMPASAPYESFPSRDILRRVRVGGGRLVDRRDLWAALTIGIRQEA